MKSSIRDQAEGMLYEKRFLIVEVIGLIVILTAIAVTLQQIL